MSKKKKYNEDEDYVPKAFRKGGTQAKRRTKRTKKNKKSRLNSFWYKNRYKHKYMEKISNRYDKK